MFIPLKKVSIFIIALILLRSELSGQNLCIITGFVLDQEDNRPLEGVNIIVKDKTLGTSTNPEGEFYLSINVNPPITIQFSMIGYEDKEITVSTSITKELKVLLLRKIIETEKIDIIAPMVEQTALEVPFSIEILHPLDIQISPALNYYDAIINLNSVNVATQSMGFTSYNMRGFNMSGNTRFLQLVDDIDIQAPGWNFPIGNMVGLVDLDVEKVELLPGPASVVYGPGAFNGVLVVYGKDPFVHQGLQLNFKSGINQIDLGPYPLYQLALNYSKVVSADIAFKINASYMSSEDWYAFDYTNVRSGSDPSKAWYEDPGYDGLNIYGDEISAELPIGEEGRNIVVARSGYYEKDLADYDIYNFKSSGALHWRLNQTTRIILQGHLGRGTTLYTGDSRISLLNFSHVQAKAEIKNDHFLLRGYINQQFSGDSYDSRSLAVNINRTWKSDADWYYEYYLAYSRLLEYLGIKGGNHIIARKYADGIGLNAANRPRSDPGTPEFEKEKERIKKLLGYQGAKIKDRTKFYNVDVKYIIPHLSQIIEIVLGGCYRFYDLDSDGTIFSDTVGNDITNYQYGIYTQLSKAVLHQRIKLSAAFRYDKDENFKGNFSPSVTALFSITQNHNIRLAYQTGFRYPTLREKFINQYIGEAKMVGGLSGVLAPLELAGNSYFKNAVDEFKEAITYDTDLQNPDRLGTSQAIIKNLNLLEAGILTPEELKEIVAEKIQSFEIGYRCLMAKRFYLDVTYYNNRFQNFIGIIRAIKPRTSPKTDDYAAAWQSLNSSQRDLLYIFRNSQQIITTSGIAFNVKYNFFREYLFTMNISWAELTSKSDDPIIPGFNTPRLTTNISLANRNFYKNLGFSIVWRWQDRFLWESSFADGDVPDYNTLDAQVSYKFAQLDVTLKIGGINVLNQYYANIYGGPKIGALYYFTLTVENIFN